MPQTLLPIFPEENTLITELISFKKQEGMIRYFHGCFPIFSHSEADLASFKMFTSQLVVEGRCKQVDIIKAFGVTAISVKRSVKTYKTLGPKGFYNKESKPKRSNVFTPEILEEAQSLLSSGLSRKEVADDLGVKQDTLYRVIKSGKLIEPSKKKT